MPKLIDTVEKIVSFAALPKGWHYGEGVPMDGRSLKSAVAILSNLARMGFLNTDAFPDIDGGVQVTAYRKSHFYEFNVDSDGKNIMVVYEKDSEVEFCQEGLSLVETLQKIEEFAKCEQSDFSIENILTSPATGFRVLLSKTPQTTGEFQWSIVNAPRIIADRYATTSQAITPDRLALR